MCWNISFTILQIFGIFESGWCSGLLAVAVISNRTKSNWNKKVLLSLTSWREVRAETQGGSLETGSEAEAIEEHCYAGLLSVACLACFLIPLRTTYPGVGLSIVGSALLYQLLIKKMIHRLACRAIWWGIFSIEFSSFQMVLACVKLKKQSTNRVISLVCLFAWNQVPHWS